MTVPPGVEISPGPARGLPPNGFYADGFGPGGFDTDCLRTNDFGGGFDVGTATTAAYNLLIGQPGLDLGEFADRLGCTIDSARAVLDRLADLGLLSRQDRDSGSDSLVALSPLTAMHRLISRERDILEQRRRFLRETVDTYSSILSAYGTGAGAEQDDAELLPDAGTLHARLQDLAGAAVRDVVSFRTFTGGPWASPALGVPLDLEPLSRGVRVRALYLDAVEFDQVAAAHARAAADAGADVRLTAELPMCMIVYDGRTAVVPRSAQRSGDGALVIRQPAVVRLLSSLFEARWQLGRPPEDPAGAVPPGGCTPVERAVLRLLATGAKDDAVARQLGTSVRTVRRVVSALMDRAGVTSRFACGAHAARQGWL